MLEKSGRLSTPDADEMEMSKLHADAKVPEADTHNAPTAMSHFMTEAAAPAPAPSEMVCEQDPAVYWAKLESMSAHKAFARRYVQTLERFMCAATPNSLLESWR
jgi:hypothetical protein